MPRCAECEREGADMRGFTRVVMVGGSKFYCSSTRACRRRRKVRSGELASGEDAVVASVIVSAPRSEVLEGTSK